MIQGTASHVGKSIITSALCRIFYRDGWKVAPFKGQNMALNSFVTIDGREMGRAQVIQAHACGISPDCEMNPILLKSMSDTGSQVIVNGRVKGNMDVKEYHAFGNEALKIIESSYKRLSVRYELIVIEGAGSPAEINLRENDIVNMRVAEMADAPVILVGDIDKGGVFASLVGTLELLLPHERKRIKGFIINKFRGDISILQKGIDYLEERTGIPVLGVIPYLKDIFLEEEDGMVLERDDAKRVMACKERIKIVVIHLPHISNFTDFDPFRFEPDVELRYVKDRERDLDADIIIIPGSKNSISDLSYLYDSGIDKYIKEAYKSGKIIVGICGGYQMLGMKISDSHGVEGRREDIKGLGLLPCETILERDKVTSQIKALPLIFEEWREEEYVSGYEIHIGRTKFRDRDRVRDGIIPAFKIAERSGSVSNILDGVISKDRRIMGTYIHGLFENDRFRHLFLNDIRTKKGLFLNKEKEPIYSYSQKRIEYIDRLADAVRDNIDMKMVYAMLSP